MEQNGIMERINLLREYNIVDKAGYDDLVAIVEMMQKQFGVALTEDNAGVMITHIAAAFGRSLSGETIEPLTPAAVAGLHQDDNYHQAVTMRDVLCGCITNKLSEMEQEFVLLHLCTLLYSLHKTGRKEGLE